MRSILTLILFMILAASLRAEITKAEFIPRDTDPEISTVYNAPQTIFVDRAVVLEGGVGHARDRHQLFVFLPGTNGTGTGGALFCELAAELGYHALSLTYPTDVAAAQVCRDDRDPTAFERFRLALIEGGVSAHLQVSRADSIENRLIKFLVLLQRRRPRENWTQFLGSGGLEWSRIAFSGQSQGGGHAGLIAVKHRVARAICLGAPKDYSTALAAPAAWYSEPSVTPKNRFFAFNHASDRQGCSPEELLQNCAALGLDSLGPPVDVSDGRPPNNGSRILMTRFPQTGDSKEAHTSVVANKYARRWRAIWSYMLTTPLDGE